VKEKVRKVAGEEIVELAGKGSTYEQLAEKRQVMRVCVHDKTATQKNKYDRRELFCS